MTEFNGVLINYNNFTESCRPLIVTTKYILGLWCKFIDIFEIEVVDLGIHKGTYLR